MPAADEHLHLTLLYNVLLLTAPGLRLGLYNPIKEALAAHQQQAAGSIHSSSSSSKSSSIHSSNSSSSSSSSRSSAVSNKLLAGTASGSLAAALLSPTELIKVIIIPVDNLMNNLKKWNEQGGAVDGKVMMLSYGFSNLSHW